MKKPLALVLVVTLSAFMQFPVASGAYASQHMDLSHGGWTVSSTDKQAEVSWSFPDHDARVALFRDGTKVDEGTSAGVFSLQRVSPGEGLNFQIQVSTRLTEDEISSVSEALHETRPQITQTVAHLEGAGLSLRVPSAGNTQVSSAQAATALPDYTIIRYTTFIRDFSVPAPAPACAPLDGRTYRFRGDARGFSPTSTSFRSRFDVRVNWLNGTAISPTRTIGQTVREVYDQPTSQWKFDASAVATNESMDLTLNGVQTANHATFNIKQDPKDPMCSFFGATANGVYFDFDFSIWRASSYSYSGTARLAPDHELYLKDSDQASWNTLFQREALSLDCLNPLSLTAIFSDCMTTAGAQGSR